MLWTARCSTIGAMLTLSFLTFVPESGGLAILGSGFIVIALVLRKRFATVAEVPSSKESPATEQK